MSKWLRRLNDIADRVDVPREVKIERRRKGFAKGAFIGTALGAVAGLLFAPKSGGQTRKDVQKHGKNLQKEAGKHVDKLTKTVQETVGQGKREAVKHVDKAQRLAEKSIDQAARGAKRTTRKAGSTARRKTKAIPTSKPSQPDR